MMSSPGIVKQSFRLQNSSGEPIFGEIRYLFAHTPAPVVVICHSFMAFKDWGFFPYVAEELAREGFLAVTFNFSRNGVLGDNNRITQFSKFEHNTFSQELEDIGIVIEAVVGREIGGGLSNGKIGLLGHSRGGGMAILFASHSQRTHALVTWSSISKLDRWTAHQKQSWRATGFLPLARDSVVSPLRLGIDLLLDLDAKGERLDVLQAASRLRIPWLIIHGTADVTVPISEAEQLFAHAGDPSLVEFVPMEHVGHLFNAATRDDDNYRNLDKVLNLTIHWLNQHL